MIHVINYITHPDLLENLLLIPPIPERVFCVRFPGENQMVQIYRTLQNTGNNHKFTFLLETGQLLHNKLISEVVSFFFLTCYLRNELRPVITTTDPLNPGIDLLTKCAKEQGFENIDIQVVPKNWAELHLIEQLFKAPFPNKEGTIRLYYPIESAKQLLAFESQIEKLEEKLKKEDQHLFDTICTNIELRKANKELTLQLKFAKKELEIINHHLKIAHASGQSKALQNYYNNEYEILPSWYKKIGHIIKALQGKRSFSSLFNSKTQKYKL